MFACVVGAQAYDFEKDGIYYNVTSLDDLTVEVTGGPSDPFNSKPYDGTYVIPEHVEWNGKKFMVTAVGDGAFSNSFGSTFLAVNLPSTITVIKSSAFRSSKLQSISIPDNVVSIEDEAFGFCTDLVEVKLPDGITRIADRLFYNCFSLSSVQMPVGIDYIGEFAFYNCRSMKNMVIPTNVKTIGLEAFSGCSSLSNVTVPSTVEYVGNGAFKYCSGLTSINWLAEGITTFVETFSGCGMESFIVPEGAQDLSNCFQNCTKLVAVVLPESTEKVINTFAGCDNLTSVTVNAPVPPEVTEGTFSANALLNGTLYVPKGCKALYESAEYWKNFSNIVETDYVPTTFCPLTAKVSGYGSISFEGQTLSNGTATWQAPAHSTATIFIQPDYGYRATATITQADGSETTLEATDVLEVEVGAEALTVEVSFERITVYLTIQQAESGCVKVGGGYGEARTVSITPYEGWRIHSVTLDGMDYTASLDADNRFTTPGLLENAFLNVAFEQDGSRVRGLQADHAKVYAQDGRLVIEQAGAGTVVRVYDEGGQLVRSLTADGGRMTVALPRGHVYLVRTVQKTVKIGL